MKMKLVVTSSENVKWSRSAVFKQTLLSACVSISYFCIGLVRGYSASAIPSIKENVPELLPTKDITSWAGAIPPFGAFFGSIVAGSLMHNIGRKYTVMIASPIWCVAWIIIALATNWGSIIIGRFISGFCAGLCIPSAQIYVTECSDPKIRGVIGSFPAIFMSGGILVSYIIGTYVAWNYLAWCSCAIAATLTFTVAFLPESPVWLKSKNRLLNAEQSSEWLKLEKPAVTIENKPDIESSQAQSSVSSHSMKVLLTRPILMPLGIGLTLLAIQQVSGIDAIIFFTVDIFRTSGSSIDGHLATIIVGTVQLVSNIISLFFVDIVGRKPLLITSGVVMCLSTASMGTAFYLNGIGNDEFGYLPLISLIIFMLGFSFGFGCIPFLLMGELFPSPQRSLLSSIAGSFNLGIMFIVIKTYHPLEEVITTAGTFWMYSVLCALGVIFVIGFVPETKGRDLESIANLFSKATRDNTRNCKIEMGHINQSFDQNEISVRNTNATSFK